MDKSTNPQMRKNRFPRGDLNSTAPRRAGVMARFSRSEEIWIRTVLMFITSIFFSCSRTASRIMNQAHCHMLYFGFWGVSFCFADMFLLLYFVLCLGGWP